MWVDRITVVAFFEALAAVLLIILGAEEIIIFILGGLLLCTWGIVLSMIAAEERAKR